MTEIRVWADGFGRWHASVPRTVVIGERRRLAAVRLTEEINEREAPRVIQRVKVVLVGGNDNECVYAEYWDDEDIPEPVDPHTEDLP